MTRRLIVVGAVGLFVAACRDGSAPTVPTEPSTSVSTANTAAPLVTPVASAAPAGGGTSCLMLNICGCNEGCTSIGIAESALKDGLTTTALSGPRKGQDLKVFHMTDAAGASVFALSDRALNMPCMAPADRAAYAYACASDKSGPVPAKACKSGCN